MTIFGEPDGPVVATSTVPATTRPAPVPVIDVRDFWIDYPDADWYAKVYCPRCDQVAFHAEDGAGLGDLNDQAQQHADVCTGGQHG